MSIVPTTSERLAGSATNGLAQSRDSAHEYRIPDDSAHRAAHHDNPPLPSIHRICSSSSTRVPSAGVL